MRLRATPLSSVQQEAIHTRAVYLEIMFSKRTTFKFCFAVYFP